LKNDVNVPSKSNKQKNLFKKFSFRWRLECQGQDAAQQGQQGAGKPSFLLFLRKAVPFPLSLNSASSHPRG
jgi:hypothetical protein